MRPRSVPLLLVAALVASSVVALAHNHVCIEADGTNLDRGGHGRPGATGATGHCEEGDLLEFSIGWRTEPPFTGHKNGLEMGIAVPAAHAEPDGHDHAEPTPVDAANVSLRAQYEFGGKTYPLELRPQFGRPGWFTDDVTPTRAGTYTLRVVGTVTVGGQVLAINFTTQPATVEPAGDIEFPEPSPDASALQAKVDALEQRVAALEARPGPGTSNGGISVDPEPTRGAPGFEALALLAAVGAVAWVARRRA